MLSATCLKRLFWCVCYSCNYYMRIITWIYKKVILILILTIHFSVAQMSHDFLNYHPKLWKVQIEKQYMSKDKVKHTILRLERIGISWHSLRPWIMGLKINDVGEMKSLPPPAPPHTPRRPLEATKDINLERKIRDGFPGMCDLDF